MSAISLFTSPVDKVFSSSAEEILIPLKSTVVTVKLLVAYTLKLKNLTTLVKTRFKDKAGWLGFTCIG